MNKFLERLSKGKVVDAHPFGLSSVALIRKKAPQAAIEIRIPFFGKVKLRPARSGTDVKSTIVNDQVSHDALKRSIEEHVTTR